MHTFLCRLLSDPPSSAVRLNAPAPGGAARAFAARLSPALQSLQDALPVRWVVVVRADGHCPPLLYRVAAQLVVEQSAEEAHLHRCPDCGAEEACTRSVCGATEPPEERPDAPPLSPSEKRCEACNSIVARAHTTGGGIVA